MMDHLDVSDPLPDFDNLDNVDDLNLDGSGGLGSSDVLNFDLQSSEIDELLMSGGSKNGGDQFKFQMDESDRRNLMMKEPLEACAEVTDTSEEIDHLKSMPIAEIDDADDILGFGDQQWDTNNDDPVLSVPQQQPENQMMMMDQGLNSGLQNGMSPQMGQNNNQMGQQQNNDSANVADLQTEKLILMERLQAIKLREEQGMNNSGSQTHQQSMLGSGFTLQRNEHVPQMPPSSNNMFLSGGPSPFATAAPTPPAAPVASVGGMGGGGAGETPLSAFLRSNKKSHGMAANKPAGVGLGGSLAGKPGAASIFSRNGNNLEAIQSNSQLPSNHDDYYVSDQAGGKPKTHLFASMDRSSVSQEMVRKLSSRGLSNSGSRSSLSRSGARGSSGNLGNAQWGSSQKTGFRTSGILSKTSVLSKSASDAHLIKRGGLAMSKKGVGSLSRENALYSMMKRNSSKNLIRRDDSSSGLVPTKRRGGSRAKLNLSRSVPAFALSNSGYAPPQGSQNAQW